ncbi:MAG: SPFH/Band 7/PHB domain protein [Clostridia bacterium]|nr:SPFH/Band 7/PHB domain protein [Clostridia bacterium]
MVNFVLVLIATLLLILLIVLCHLRVVPESKAYVMERLGVYSRTWHTGWHVKVPFVERKRAEVDLREQILVFSNPKSNGMLNNGGSRKYLNVNGELSYDHENKIGKIDKPAYAISETWGARDKNADIYVITKDNIKMGVDIVVFYQITDPKLFVYGHANPLTAINHLTITALRNLFGDLELDAALTSRDTVNSKMRTMLDEAADAWGVRITRVEIKDIIPPDGILKAMEAQMRAERDRRAKVIEAEGTRKAAILTAEGEKQAEILKAEAEKHKLILEAEGRREAEICEGEGEAERILLVEQARAEGLKLINAAAPTAEAQNIYLGVKSLEALEKASTGESNTIIIPSEVQSLAGLAKSAAEVFKA